MDKSVSSWPPDRWGQRHGVGILSWLHISHVLYYIARKVGLLPPCSLILFHPLGDDSDSTAFRAAFLQPHSVLCWVFHIKKFSSAAAYRAYYVFIVSHKHFFRGLIIMNKLGPLGSLDRWDQRHGVGILSWLHISRVLCYIARKVGLLPPVGDYFNWLIHFKVKSLNLLDFTKFSVMEGFCSIA